MKDHEASAAHREAIETDLKRRQMERTSGFGVSATKRNLLAIILGSGHHFEY